MTTMADQRIVGVLGGMGPLATADFLRKLTEATPAERDQDHLPVLAASIPQVPDRVAAYRGDGESPLPALVAIGRRLAAAGAELIVMPCNTAHLWYDELHAALGLPMLHLADAAIDAVVARCGEGATVGLLATDATLASGLYVNRAGARVRWVLPTADEVLGELMPGIAAVKAHRLDSARAHLQRTAEALQRRGAQALVLGCTEIPLVLADGDCAVPVIDATEALARAAVGWARAAPAAA